MDSRKETEVPTVLRDQADNAPGSTRKTIINGQPARCEKGRSPSEKAPSFRQRPNSGFTSARRR